MTKKFYLLLIGILLVACGATEPVATTPLPNPSTAPIEQAATAQPTATTPAPQYQAPTPLPVAEPVTAAQAANLSLRYRAGYGVINDTDLHPYKDIFAAASSMGIWLYEANATPLALIAGEQAFAVRWSPDGSWLAARQADQIVVYHPTTQQVYRVLAAGYGPDSTLAWSGDGKLLASDNADGIIFVWSLESGQLIRQLYPLNPETTIHALTFASDQQILAAGQTTSDGTNSIAIWQVAAGELQRELRGQNSPIDALAWDEDTGLLASGTQDGSVWLWQIEHAKAVAALPHPDEEPQPIQALVWTGKSLSALDQKGNLFHWDTTSGAPTQVADGRLAEWTTTVMAADLLSEHFAALHAVDWTPLGQVLAAAAADGKLHIFDSESWQLLNSLNVNGQAIQQLSISPDGKWVAASNADQQLILWPSDLSTPQVFDYDDGEEADDENETSAAFPLAWSPDGKNLAVSYERLNIEILTAGTNDVQRRLMPPAPQIESDGAIPESEPPALPYTLNALAWSPDGALLGAGDNYGNLMIWDMATGEMLQTLPAYQQQIYALSWSPDGQTLALSGSDEIFETEVIRFWERELARLNGEITLSWVAEVRGLAWSPNGELIAVGYTDATTNRGAIQLWDAASHELLTTLSAHNAAITSLTWSPDGSVLASSSRDGTVGFWGLGP